MHRQSKLDLLARRVRQVQSLPVVVSDGVLWIRHENVARAMFALHNGRIVNAENVTRTRGAKQAEAHRSPNVSAVPAHVLRIMRNPGMHEVRVYRPATVYRRVDAGAVQHV